jgi:hypothetical protein
MEKRQTMQLQNGAEKAPSQNSASEGRNYVKSKLARIGGPGSVTAMLN